MQTKFSYLPNKHCVKCSFFALPKNWAIFCECRPKNYILSRLTFSFFMNNVNRAGITIRCVYAENSIYSPRGVIKKKLSIFFFLV